MTYQITDPVDIPRLQQILNALQAAINEREQATAALARMNAELYGELQRRMAESESFNRVLVSLLQKTVLDQVLDIVCTEAQGLIGATASAPLLLADQAWLEVKHRLGKPLAAVEPVPVDGSLAGQVVRQGEPVVRTTRPSSSVPRSTNGRQISAHCSPSPYTSMAGSWRLSDECRTPAQS